MSDSGSFEFDSVPIVEVTSDNAKEMEPAIRVAIANSDFVSIDCVSSLTMAIFLNDHYKT